MAYQFRLTFHHMKRGYIRIEKEFMEFCLDSGMQLRLMPRDADSLHQASKFHLESFEYPDEASARADGEKLRTRLHVLNGLLGLGFVIPTVDTTSGSVSEDIKEKLRKEHGGETLDTIVGLAVFPEENHFEYVFSAAFEVYPSDPEFLFKALNAVWHVEMPLTPRSEDAIEILGRAVTETSPRTKFLLTFLAAERMVDRSSRSDAAKMVIDGLLQALDSSPLPPKEIQSLKSSLGGLKQHSFTTALMDLAEQLGTSEQAGGLPLRDFLSNCVSARNTIAHNANLCGEVSIQALSDGLRRFVMQLIWTENKLPNVTIQVPADAVTSLSEGLEVRIR